MLSLDQLIAGGQVRAAAWSPDGMQIAFVWQREGVSRLWTVDAAGGFPRLVSPHEILMDTPADAPSWRPDGKSLLYLSSAGGSPNLWSVPTDGGQPHRLTKGPGKESAPTWSPDGRHIAFLTDRDGFDQLALIPVAADGSAAGWPRPLTTMAMDCREPQWSPDGSTIAFIGLEGLDSSALFLLNLESGELRAVRTSEPAFFSSPAWAPDGRRLVCINDSTGFAHLWLVDALSAQAFPVPMDDSAEKGSPSWSPDGRDIVYTFNRNGYIGVGLWHQGEHVELVPPTGVALQPQFSPDGKRLLFVCHDSRQAPDIYVQEETGERRQVSFSGPPGILPEQLVEPTLVEYLAEDGLTIPAFLYKPVPAAAGRSPMIIYPHGGPTSQHTAGWYPFIQFFVAKGYGVLAPNFRGSTGYGRAFELANRGEWGKLDLSDVIRGAEFARSLDWVDPDRVGIWGGSYGGYLALLALSKSPGTFRCGVDFYGVSNRFTSWRDTDRIGRRNIERKLGRPTEDPALYRAASPLVFEANIREPLLIMHGENDTRVPFGQSVEIVEALRRRGFPVEFHAYPEEGHGFLKPKHLRDIYTKVEQFFALYL
ncbi:MAG: S9 family peptidase [Bacillota bacterium]